MEMLAVSHCAMPVKETQYKLFQNLKLKLDQKNSNNVLNSKLHKNFNVKRNIVTAAVEQL